jgi:hypothetical protein
VLAVLAPLGAGALPASAADGASGVIVTFVDSAHRTDLLHRLPSSRHLVGPRAAAASLPAGEANALRAQPGVLRVEPDVAFHAMRTVNDTCVTLNCAGVQEWAVAKVNAPTAWDYSLGSGVTIGVLDSGVVGTHPDLAGKLVAPELDDTSTASGDGDHGTSVAGYAAANTNNVEGIAGFGWDSRILAIKVLDADGNGLASWVSKGIYDATDRGAKVINLSLGSDQDSQAVRDAVTYAFNHGVVVVASVGNDGGTGQVYPASIPGVIGVGASTPSDALATFSNRGPGLDVSAPGQSLPAPVPPNAYANVSGTSFSAPIVSGVAALLLSQGVEPASGIQARLQETGVALSGGNGVRIDAGAALAVLRAYPGFGGGTRIATGDLTADGGAEIVTGAAAGGGPHVRVLTAAPGYAERSSFFAYDAGFGGGVDVATGNVDGTGRPEIITGAGPGGGPHVRIFSAAGSPMGPGFFAYGSGFRGGVSVASGDLDGDGTDEIVTGAGPGGGPHVRIFSANGAPIGPGFFAYDAGFRGGVDVAVGDVDGDGKDEIITGAGPGGGPHVRLWRGNGASMGPGFFAYSAAFPGGVRVSSLAGSSGAARILTGPGSGGGPHVRLFNINGAVLAERFGFNPAFTGGVDVALGPAGPLVGQLSGDTLVRTLLGS